MLKSSSNLCQRVGRSARLKSIDHSQFTFHLQARSISSTPLLSKKLETPEEIASFLSTPTWSVKSLLPTSAQTDAEQSVTPKQLHHLLRLSALPPPSSAEEEASMLRDLKAQLHFVKAIQQVDATGVEPLRTIRDETAEAERENEITLESMREALASEEVVGKFHKRIRRRHVVSEEMRKAEEWDVLGQASKKVGRYFVVESGAAMGAE